MYEYAAKIERVIDGDTVEALIDLGFSIHVKQTMRLFGINTPELHGAEKALGQAAKTYLASLVEGKQIVVRTYKDRDDKYGRTLAVLVVGNVEVNQHMVDKGHAKPYFGGVR